MGIKTYRPYTPSRRQMTGSDFSEITKTIPDHFRTMGIWDEDGITNLLQIPEDQELAALIAIGHPDIDPDTPKRKSVSDLLTYL